MKKILTSVGLVLLAMSCVPSRMIEMDKDTLLDNIKGGWAGQTIGCTYGGPTEFYYRSRMIPDSVAIVCFSQQGLRHVIQTGS